MTEAIVEHATHFQHRVIQDALADATATYWHRRAAAFEAARPRAGDYRGQATLADLRAADQRCAETAEACRVRATASLIQDGLEVVA